MEVVSGDNWSYKTCKAPVKLSPPTNQHPAFHRPDVLPIAHPASVKAPSDTKTLTNFWERSLAGLWDWIAMHITVLAVVNELSLMINFDLYSHVAWIHSVTLVVSFS